MSGDIDKILSELSKMQIPGFFGSVGLQTKFQENVSTSDSMRYQLATSSINQAYPDSASTSDKLKIKTRTIDSTVFSSETVRVKSRSGDSVLLVDILKSGGGKLIEPGAGTSEAFRYRISIADSASTVDLLKSIKVILSDSVLVTDKYKGINAIGDSAATSELVRLKLKVPDSVATGDAMKQGLSFKQAYTDAVTTSDLLNKIKVQFSEQGSIPGVQGLQMTSDQEVHRWKLSDAMTTSDLIHLKLATLDTLTTTDLCKKYKLQVPETPTIVDTAKSSAPHKTLDSSGTSELLKLTMNLGTGTGAELETTTDAQSSYIITNVLLNNSFDVNLNNWTTSASGGGSVAQVSSPVKFGAGAVKCDSTSAITGIAYLYQTFTNITSGLTYLNWWMYPSSYGVTGFNGGHSINVRDSGLSTWCFTIHPASDGIYLGNLGANSSNWTQLPGISPLAIGVWHHFNVLYDITNKLLTIYLNGMNIYSIQNITTQNVGSILFGDAANNVLAGLFYYDEAAVGTVTTQGSSLKTNIAPSIQALPYSFDTQTGYDSSSSSNSGSGGSGGGGGNNVKYV